MSRLFGSGGFLIGVVLFVATTMLQHGHQGEDGDHYSMVESKVMANAFPNNYKEKVDQICQHIVKGEEKGKLYDLLAFLTDTYGSRLVGTEGFDLTCKHFAKLMEVNHFDNVHTEPVYNITHWRRGEPESLIMHEPRYIPHMEVLALGTSPSGYVKGEVVVIKSYEELDQEDVRGKIVLFNLPWQGNYGQSVIFRTRGPAEAAKRGASACLVRSVTPFSIYSAHTGVTTFQDNEKKIPAATITVEDAEMIERMTKRGQRVVLSLKLNCQNNPPLTSYNTLGEITGSTYPNEVIVVGGHMDSWDLNSAPMDDIGGILTFYQGMKTLIKLGLRPKRTIRLVAFTAEEFGGGRFGGMGYVKAHEKELKDHILAIESDAGPFRPLGFEFTGGQEGRKLVELIASSLFTTINTTIVTGNGGGADVDPLYQEAGIPVMSPKVEGSKYFWFHHTKADTMTVLNSDDLDLAAAQMGAFLYVVADMDIRFPRN